MKKAILVSMRFNPGHISHIQANSNLLEAEGFDIRFTGNKRFQAFASDGFQAGKACAKDYFTLSNGDLFIVWFPSISVVFFLLFVRLFTQATTVYIYHEPYTSFASYRAAGFSCLKSLRVIAISLVSRFVCALSDKIILPSMRAFNAVPEAGFEPKRYAKLNLMFADESDPTALTMSRNYVSYIGTIAEDHAFDEFVYLMQKCVAEQRLTPFKFLIASRSVIPEKHLNAISQCMLSGRLVLQSGEPMTNGQINKFFSQSFVVWNAYKRSMQSGVLPKAYMFGTPVLVSASNQNEYFEDGVHGVLISDLYTVDEFQQAVNKLEASWAAISQNCRSYYLNNFDYRALSNTFMYFVTDKT